MCIRDRDKTQRKEIGRDPKTAIPDCGESEEISGTPSSNEPKVIRICSLNVENLVTKISEPDFVSYVKSFDVFVPSRRLQALILISAHTLTIITFLTRLPSNFRHVARGPEVLPSSLIRHSCLS